MTTRLVPLLLAAVLVLVAACGGNGASDATATSGEGDALTSEAQQASAGDIPDNQVFLTFENAKAGYSIRYPEGWAQSGDAGRVSFRDKDNVVRIDVARGGRVSAAEVSAELDRRKQATPSLTFEPPTEVTLHGSPAIKAVYTTAGPANAVTGKRVRLVVDRYVVPGPGRHAVIDLGTPEGVDNVDAYRLMSESFRWR